MEVPLIEDPLTVLDGLASVAFGFGSVAIARVTPLRRLTLTMLGKERRPAVNLVLQSFEAKERGRESILQQVGDAASMAESWRKIELKEVKLEGVCMCVVVVDV